MTTERVLPHPCTFGDPQSPQLGIFHPAIGNARPTVVVLCNPFGYESLCVHRAYRHLASALAAEGVAVLRFDYPGTGDSSGDDLDPHRVRAWIDGIHAAIDEAKSRAGVTNVSLFGARLGATLATVAASERTKEDDVEALVLWAPLVTGKAYTRELRAFRLLKQQEGVAPAADEPSLGDEAVGFLLTKSTSDDLGKISLLTLAHSPARRVLLLARDDLAIDPKLAAHWRSLGAVVDEGKATGHAELMLDPHESIVPRATFATIVEWLTRGDASGEATTAHDAPSTVTLDLPAIDGVALREEAIRFGSDLFGLVTAPNTAHERHGKTGVLFLNVGANHRVGPNRMYVTMARHLSALGFVSMRFDIKGIGDSPPLAGKDERRLYAMDSIDDVRDAMEVLRARHGVERVVLIGLCSGAYLAYHAAARLPRVEGVVLINPQTYQWREGDSLKLAVRGSIRGQEFYRRAIWQPETWRRAFRGEVNLRAISRGFGKHLQKKIMTAGKRMLTRALRKKPDATDVAATFLDLVGKGSDVLMVFSDDDAGLDEMELHLGPGARRMRGHERFGLRIVDRADHTFTTTSAQRRLRDLIASHLIASARSPNPKAR